MLRHMYMCVYIQTHIHIQVFIQPSTSTPITHRSEAERSYKMKLRDVLIKPLHSCMYTYTDTQNTHIRARRMTSRFHPACALLR
jgi:hypothetical protein